MSHFDKKENREIMDVPTICPICGEKLKIDTCVDGRIILRCPNPKCNYEKDITTEFKNE